MTTKEFKTYLFELMGDDPQSGVYSVQITFPANAKADFKRLAALKLSRPIVELKCGYIYWELLYKDRVTANTVLDEMLLNASEVEIKKTCGEKISVTLAAKQAAVAHGHMPVVPMLAK